MKKMGFDSRVSAAVPPSVARELARVAKNERRTMSQVILVALEQYFERRRNATKSESAA